MCNNAYKNIYRTNTQYALSTEKLRDDLVSGELRKKVIARCFYCNKQTLLRLLAVSLQPLHRTRAARRGILETRKTSCCKFSSMLRQSLKKPARTVKSRLSPCVPIRYDPVRKPHKSQKMTITEGGPGSRRKLQL